MKKLRLLACTAALILIATSVFEVTVDESGITTNNRGGRRLALRDHVLRRLRRRRTRGDRGSGLALWLTCREVLSEC